MKKFLIALILVGAAGCAPKLDAATMALFPALEANTTQLEQSYRVVWQAKIKDNLKDGLDKQAIMQYLDSHGVALDGLKNTAVHLNKAMQAQQR